MSASRFNKKSRERLLYIAVGMMVFVILSLAAWIIPHAIKDTLPAATPEKAVTAFYVLFVMHLILLAVLIGKIQVSHRGGRLHKTGFIIAGIILILMSMFLIDTAGAFLANHPDMFSVAVILSISAFFDLISGVITIMLPTRLPDNQDKIKISHP